MAGDDRSRALAASASIVEGLEKEPRAWVPAGASRTEHSIRDLSLAWGAAGFLTAFSYCSPGETRSAIIESQASSLAEGFARHPLPPALFRGFLGIGWILSHLKSIGASDGFASDDLDNALDVIIASMNRQREHDLMYGLVGVGVYVLELQAGARRRRALTAVVGALEANGARTEEGVSWWTAPEHLDPGERRAWPEGRADLGMAHGSAGVIAFLAAAIRRHPTRAAVRLLEGAVSWLLHQRLAPGRGSIFSAYCDRSKRSAKTRLAWCYGDLGAAVALTLAARSLGREEWKEEALRIALHAADRPFRDGLKDTSLCHGSSGVAHLFNRLFQYLGHPRLAEAAVRWYRHCLAAGTTGGFGGYGVARLSARSEKLDPGFLMGAAGVALALQAGASDVAPAWDRVLLCSTP